MIRRFSLVFLACACATVKAPDVEELKPTVEAFNQRVRWKDFRSAADLVVPERREAFVKGRSRLNDERDLFVTDFQLEDAQVQPDTQVARVVSKLSWYRLPSTSEQTATLTSVYAWRDGKWLLESQDAGPFEDLLPSKDAPRENTGPTENRSLRPGGSTLPR